MADISSILTALGTALVGGSANVPLDIRNNPLAAAAYNTGTINQRNIEAARALDQQRVNQDGSQFARQASAAMVEKIYSFMVANRFVLQVTGQLPMFQRLLNGYTQTAADGDTSRLSGLPSLQDMMDEAAKQSHRFDHATDMDLTMMGATPEDIKSWRVNHPVPGTSPAPLSHPALTLTTPGSVTGLGNPVSHPQLTAPPLLQAPTSGPKVGYTDLTSTTPSPVLGAVPVTSMSNAPAGGWGDATNYPPGYDVTAAMPDPLAAQLYQQTLGAPEMQGLAGPLPARAGGGPVTAGQPYVVGDGSGPETVVPGPVNTPPMGGAPASVPQPSDPTPDPANPVESASPGFGNFATTLYQKGLQLINSFQTLTPRQAQIFASQMVGDIYSDPAVVASRLDLGNTLDPRFASTPDDTAAAQKNYITALAGATDKATQLLTARMAPYTATNDSSQKQLDELNKLGTTVFGGEGVGGTVGKLMTAGLAPGAQGIARTTAQAAVLKSQADMAAAEESARHNAREEDVDAVKPILARIQQRESERAMAAGSLGGAVNFNVGPGGVIGGGGASASASQRALLAQLGTKSLISDVLALRKMGQQGNRYAAAVAAGYAQAMRAEYAANPGSWDVIPPEEITMRGLDLMALPDAERAAKRAQAQAKGKATLDQFDAATTGAKSWVAQKGYAGISYRKEDLTPGKPGSPLTTETPPPGTPGTPGTAPATSPGSTYDTGGTGGSSMSDRIQSAMMRPSNAPPALPPPPGGWGAYYRASGVSPINVFAPFDQASYDRLRGKK